MRSTLTLFLALACTLFGVACWTQFDPPPEPNDDDTSVDDDDTSVDDDDTSVDDDDTSVDDDDTVPAGCVEADTIDCFDDFPANNNAPGSTDNVLSYSCNGLEFTGPEYAVRWDATTTGSATVTVSGISAGEDLDLFVLNDPAGTGCDPASCMTSSNGTGQEESATFDAVAGQSYYFVVDGYSDSVSNFTMSVDCDPIGDDDDTADDDDTTTDDDDTAPNCDDPVVIGAVVTLTDPAGALTSSLSTSSPMTVNVSVANSAGNTGTTSFTYGSPCIFNWSLWYQDSTPSAPHPVSGGPTCSGGFTSQDYTCGAPPVVGSDSISPIEGVSGNPVPAGSYDLVVDTIYFGTFNFVVTVP